MVRMARDTNRAVSSHATLCSGLRTREDRAIMNWEMLAALGQLLAVFVGIPSLIYLATQIREQTKERRQAAVHALTVQWGDLTESLHDNAETAAIFLRGMHSFTELDAVSKLRFSALFNRLINLFAGR